MRDGIYKDLPMGRGWKSLLKSCERVKERGVTAQIKATRAVISELNGDLGAVFFHNLSAAIRAGETILPGFAVLDSNATARDLGGSNTPFENDLLSSAKRQLGRGLRGREALDNALRESIENLKQRRIGHIEQHYLLNGGLQTKPVINAARAAINEIDSTSLASEFEGSARPKKPKLVRTIELEESLEEVQ